MPTTACNLMSVDDLIARWRGQVKAATLATWRSRRLGPPYVKVGGRVLYPLQAVEEYERRNTRK
jgi:phosphatidylserine decarboxylase